MVGSPKAKTRGTPFTMIHPRIFHTFSFFSPPGLVRKDFFYNGVPRYTTGKWRGHEALSIGRIKSQYAGPGCRKNVECRGAVIVCRVDVVKRL